MTDPNFGRLVGIAAAIAGVYAASRAIGERRDNPAWWSKLVVALLAWGAALWMLLR